MNKERRQGAKVPRHVRAKQHSTNQYRFTTVSGGNSSGLSDRFQNTHHSYSLPGSRVGTPATGTRPVYHPATEAGPYTGDTEEIWRSQSENDLSAGLQSPMRSRQQTHKHASSRSPRKAGGYSRLDEASFEQRLQHLKQVQHWVGSHVPRLGEQRPKSPPPVAADAEQSPVSDRGPSHSNQPPVSSHPTAATTRRTYLSNLPMNNGQPLHQSNYSALQVPETRSALPPHRQVYGPDTSTESVNAKPWPAFSREPSALVFYPDSEVEAAQVKVAAVQRDGGFNLPASFSQSTVGQVSPEENAQAVAEAQKENERLMHWYMESSDPKRPTTRSEVYQVHQWLQRQLMVLQEDTAHLVAAHEAEASSFHWTLDRSMKGLNWLLQGHGWKERLRALHDFEKVYTQGFQEVVRQVAAHCVERGALLEALWSSLRAVLHEAIKGLTHSAQAADNLHRQIEDSKDDLLLGQVAQLKAEVVGLKMRVEQSEAARAMARAEADEALGKLAARASDRALHRKSLTGAAGLGPRASTLSARRIARQSARDSTRITFESVRESVRRQDSLVERKEVEVRVEQPKAPSPQAAPDEDLTPQALFRKSRQGAAAMEEEEEWAGGPGPSRLGDAHKHELELDLDRAHDEVDRLQQAFEDAQVNEEEAWAEVRALEEEREGLTPRPLWNTSHQFIKTILDRVPETKPPVDENATKEEQQKEASKPARCRTQAIVEEIQVSLLEAMEELEARPKAAPVEYGPDGLPIAGKKKDEDFPPLIDEGATKRAAAIAATLRGARPVRVASAEPEPVALEFSWDRAIEAVEDLDNGKPRPFFVGLGDVSGVPKFLRITGKVRNKNMSKRETEGIIKEIWDQKAKHDGDQKPMELDKFVWVYLHKRYGLDTAAKETGYNFLRGLKTYQYDADCELFLKILIGEVTEEVYLEQKNMVKDLMFLFKTVDERANTGRIKGKLSKADFSRTLREFFYTKTEEELKELGEALEEDQAERNPQDWGKGQVCYKTLFEETRNFDQGPFAECLRDQHLNMRERFINDVQTVLEEACPEGMVNPPLAIEALIGVDPNMKMNHCHEYLSRGFHITVDEVVQALQDANPVIIPIDQFINGVKSGVIMRSKPDSGRQGKGKGGKTKNSKSHRATILRTLNAINASWTETSIGKAAPAVATLLKVRDKSRARSNSEDPNEWEGEDDEDADEVDQAEDEQEDEEGSEATGDGDERSQNSDRNSSKESTTLGRSMKMKMLKAAEKSQFKSRSTKKVPKSK